MDTALNWVINTLNASALSSTITNNTYIFPMLEMAHFLGLCLLFGALLVVDLRLIGIASAAPVTQTDKFVYVALVGFLINLTTGLLFLVADSDRYLVNVAFWTKMGLIALAGLNMAWFIWRVKPQMTASVDSAAIPTGAHMVAWTSLILWIFVITAGRFIPYVEDL